MIVKVLDSLLRLPLLDFVPKGYLTKVGSVLQVIAGVIVLAGAIVTGLIGYIEMGTVPDFGQMENMLGALLLGNGAASLGVRRAMGD